jgi:hypothetical protein
MISINIKYLLITLLIGIINAEEENTPKMMIVSRLGYGGLLIAVLIMLIGIVNLITGKRLIIYLLFLNGLIFFASCVIMIAVQILHSKSEQIRKFQIIWVSVCAIFFGLVGGLLCCRFYRFGVGIMGLIMGYIIAKSISQEARLEVKWILALSWGVGIIFAIISVRFLDSMIVINTSFIGAQTFILGVDFIIDKRYIYLIQVSASIKPIELTPTLWGMLVSSILLNLLGILIQYKAYKGTQYYKITVKK